MATKRHRHTATGRTIPRIFAVAAAIGLTVVAIVGWTLWRARQDAWRSAAAASENLAMSVSRSAETSVAFYDRSLIAVARVVSLLRDDDDDPLARPQALLDRFPIAPELGPVAVTDEFGRVVASTSRAIHPRGESVADHDFFVRWRGGGEGALDVSRPFRLSATGEWCVSLTRRLRRGDGRFAGVIVTTLPVSRFQDVTSRLNLGQHGEVTLLRQDGFVIARTPFREAEIGKDVRGSDLFQRVGTPPQGVSEARVKRDGVNRLFSYSRVGELPLVVTVAASMDDVFADWRLEAAIIGGATLALVAALLVGALALRRELLGRIAAEEDARGSSAQFRLLAENSSDIILRLDRDGVQRYVSPAAQDLLGCSPSLLVGHDWRLMADPEDRPTLDAAMARLRAGAERATIQYRCRHDSGHLVWVEASLRLVRDDAFKQPHGAIANIRDVTWRKQAEDELAIATAKLEVLASTDGLTSLANRRSFDETLSREWRRARRAGGHLALLLLDADWFKAYNDRYGHQRGDDALRAISACITQSLKRPGDFAARYGGEEFAVVLPGNDEGGAMQVAEEIRSCLTGLAIPHDGAPAGIMTVSIGIASLKPALGGDSADLLASADAALYAAKRGGRDRVATATAAKLALAES
jgi:diguanylate cyclase (GGDEF)-like protein/PAS domain S-box-containing protein